MAHTPVRIGFSTDLSGPYQSVDGPAGAHGKPIGTLLHDMYLLRVKSPEQSTGDWDFYNLVTAVPGSEAFPLE